MLRSDAVAAQVAVSGGSRVVCTDRSGIVLPGCVCHPSCASCGLGANATTQAHCLSCADEDAAHWPLRMDGTGVCVVNTRSITTTVRESFVAAGMLESLADPAVWERCKGRWLQWLDRSRAPRTVWEQLVRQVWHGHPAASRAAGFEYWCNVLHDGDRPLGWHADADAIRQLRREVALPELGAVFYGFPHQVEGGDLQIAPLHARPRVAAAQAGPEATREPGEWEEETGECEEGCERVQPEYNSLVVFDVRRLHRVGRFNGSRYSFQVRRAPRPLRPRLIPFDVPRRKHSLGSRHPPVAVRAAQANVWNERPLSIVDLTKEDLKQLVDNDPEFDIAAAAAMITGSRRGRRKTKR